MAVTIAEPNDVESGTLNDNNAILVYQQSSMGAGIRKLALADWKNYLGYNGQKVNNLESYTGMDPSYAWDDPSNTTPYTNDTSKVDLTNRIERIANKAGITYDQPYDSTFPTFEERITDVEDKTTNLRTDLGTKPTGFNDAFTEIDNLKQEIGGPGSGGQTVTGRVQALENTVDGPSGQPQNGLKGIVNGYDTEEGGTTVHNPGLKEFVQSGYDITTGGTTTHHQSLNEIVVDGYTPQGGSHVDGLQSRTSNLELSVDGDMSASPNPVLGLKREVEGYDNGGTHVNGLLENVEDLQHKMDGWTDSSTTPGTTYPSLYTSTLGSNGLDWNGETDSIATKVKQHDQAIAGLSGVYKLMGNIYNCNGTSTSDPTTYIEINDDDPPTRVNLSTLENGWVYNVIADPLTIWTSSGSKKYNKGMNLAWVKTGPSDPGHFDELGATIDVDAIEQEIQDVDTRVTGVSNRVTALENKYGNSTSLNWVTDNTFTGRYMFNANINTSGSTKLYVFIASLSNGTIDVANNVVDLSGNFTDAFDTTLIANKISLKSGATSANISWNKIS